jgi:hypothetical protein
MKKFLIGILKVFGWVTLFIVVYLGLVISIHMISG